MYHNVCFKSFEEFDGEYVRRLTAGDSGTGEHFASYFSKVLKLKLHVRLRRPDAIPDLLQTTLLRSLLILRRGDGMRCPERLGALVNRVCDNVIMEHYRAEGRVEPWDPDMPEPADLSFDPDADLVTEDRRRVIRQILDALPERDRLILIAIYLQDMDKGEICARFHVEPGHLRVLQHRAKARFRAAYDQMGDPLSINPVAA